MADCWRRAGRPLLAQDGALVGAQCGGATLLQQRGSGGAVEGQSEGGTPGQRPCKRSSPPTCSSCLAMLLAVWCPLKAQGSLQCVGRRSVGRRWALAWACPTASLYVTVGSARPARCTHLQQHCGAIGGRRPLVGVDRLRWDVASPPAQQPRARRPPRRCAACRRRCECVRAAGHAHKKRSVAATWPRTNAHTHARPRTRTPDGRP